ncbi:MAG: hypothetical protein M0R37_12520 [Bacteroidales bacterium]|nr:hypothetical protein [Bacteroidales bacterium]
MAAAKTSDKVGWIAAAVLVIAAIILMLWPSLKKRGSSSSADDKQMKPSEVDPSGLPPAGETLARDGSSQLAVGATGTSKAEAAAAVAPKPEPPRAVRFYDPGQPPEIE